VWPQKDHCEKRCEIQGGSQEMAVMVDKWQNFLITTIKVNLCCLLHISLGFGTKFTLLLKNFPLAYHHSHFLATTLDFTSFFTMAFLGPHPFLQLGCFKLDFTFFAIAYCVEYCHH